MLPLHYLQRQDVSFLLGHPTLIPRGYLAGPDAKGFTTAWLGDCLGFSPEPAVEATVVAMPITDRFALLMWYLTPSPKLDRRIRERGWEVAEFQMRL